jgi:hypothetical protein
MRACRTRLPSLSLLWWRHQAAEPKDPRPYFIALAHCAERPWHLKALMRYANRRWPIMAGELGEGWHAAGDQGAELRQPQIGNGFPSPPEGPISCWPRVCFEVRIPR